MRASCGCLQAKKATHKQMNKYRPMPEMRPVRHAGSAEDLMMMMTMMEVDAKKI